MKKKRRNGMKRNANTINEEKRKPVKREETHK